MPKTAVSDLKFKADRSGLMGTTKSDADYIIHIAKRLFYTVPGSDDYDPNRGLNIRSEMVKQHPPNGTNVEYQLQIEEQFKTYTDIQPMAVHCWYVNRSMVVFMTVAYRDRVYNITINPDQDDLGLKIDPVRLN